MQLFKIEEKKQTSVIENYINKESELKHRHTLFFTIPESTHNQYMESIVEVL